MLKGHRSNDSVDTKQVVDILQAQFPHLSPASVSDLGEGCDSSAFDVNARWVFRFPKRADVEQQLLLEMRVLPVLATHSPLPLPAFCFHGQPSEAFPRQFGGYARLPGVPALGVDPAIDAVRQLGAGAGPVPVVAPCVPGS